MHPPRVLPSLSAGPFGQLSHPGLLTFGTFNGQHSLYNIQDLPIFALLGVVGGLCGAAFNGGNRRLTIWRSRRVASPWRRFGEAIGVAVLTGATAFALVTLAPCCQGMGGGTVAAGPPPGLPPAPPSSPPPLHPAPSNGDRPDLNPLQVSRGVGRRCEQQKVWAEVTATRCSAR